MARMSINEKSSSKDLVDNYKLNNWILDSGTVFRKTPHVLGFIPGQLEDMDNYTEVADRSYVMEMRKSQHQRGM